MKALSFVGFFLLLLRLPVWAADPPRYDVRQFGATGDGHTDDQRALQAAANAASRTPGAIVSIPRGVYLHSGVVDFASNTVEGAGAESVLVAASPAAAAIRFADAAYCALRHIKVSAPAHERLQNDEAAAILIANSQHCAVSHVFVEGAAAAGINVHASADIVVDGVEIRNTRADGIHVVSGSRHVSISNNTAYDTGDDSFSAVAYQDQEQTTHVTFTNNVSWRSNARGVTCIGVDDCIIENNQVYAPAAHGIAIAWESSYHTWHPHHARIENNLVRRVQSGGMNPLLIDGASDVEVGANSIDQSNPVYLHESSHLALHDIMLESSRATALIVRDCQNVSIVDTRVRGARDSAFIFDKVRHVTFEHNLVEDVLESGEMERAAMEILESRDVAGSGNYVAYSNRESEGKHKTLRLVSSSAISLSIEESHDRPDMGR